MCPVCLTQQMDNLLTRCRVQIQSMISSNRQALLFQSGWSHRSVLPIPSRYRERKARSDFRIERIGNSLLPSSLPEQVVWKIRHMDATRLPKILHRSEKSGLFVVLRSSTPVFPRTLRYTRYLG